MWGSIYELSLGPYLIQKGGAPPYRPKGVGTQKPLGSTCVCHTLGVPPHPRDPPFGPFWGYPPRPRNRYNSVSDFGPKKETKIDENRLVTPLLGTPLGSYFGTELAHKFTPPPLDPTKGVPKDKMRGIPWYTIVRRTLWTVFKDLRPLCHELCHGTSLRGSKFAALFLWGKRGSRGWRYPLFGSNMGPDLAHKLTPTSPNYGPIYADTR